MKNLLTYSIVALLLAVSCREAPRSNPFDPVNSPVMITIQSPTDNSTFQLGQTITFRAISSTDDIPSVEDAIFRWASDRDGTLALESFFQIDSLSAGTHTITLDVSAGELGRASKSITVVIQAAAALAVQINEPPGDTTFLVGSGLAPRADEWLPADAERIAARSWKFGSESGIDDKFVEEPDTIYWNVPGVYNLVYTVIDNLGRQAADSVQVTVLAMSTPPQVLIISPLADTTIVPGQTLMFEATDAAGDAPIVQRSWLFPEGSGLEGSQDTSALAGNKTFLIPGTFPVVYGVRDALGAAVFDTVTIAVSDTASELTVDIVQPEQDDITLIEGDSVYFAGFFSPADVTIENHFWDFDSTSGMVSHTDSIQEPGWKTFSLPGIFTVSYSAIDNRGKSDTSTVSVIVNPNQAPETEIVSPSDTTIPVNSSLTFTASDTDPDGSVSVRYWSWPEESGIEPSAQDSAMDAGERIFAAAGTFVIHYTVTDNKGLSSMDSVTVTAIENQLPGASIDIPAADTSLFTGDSLLFQATASDPDGALADSSWEVTIDGQPSGTIEAPVAGGFYYIFSTAGTYQIRLIVNDNLGVEASDSVIVTVEDAPVEPVNELPSASIISPPDTMIAAGNTLTFFASDFDSDGTIVSRQWNFGTGSGVDATGATSDFVQNIQFNNPGAFDVTYTVTDDLGGSYTTQSVRITVVSNNAPVVSIVSPVQDNVSIASGAFITFQATDSDPDGRVVARLWDYGAGSGLAQDTVAFPGNRTFSAAGTFIVRYSATDNYGATGADSITVVVNQ